VRDVERLRERIELSLDDRQVVALGVCALLLFGGVFSLGILLGKKLSPQPPAVRAGDLAALDAQARKPEPASSLAVEKAEPVRPASLIAPPPQKPTVVPAPAKPAQVAPATSSLTLTPPPRELGSFTVQVGASQDRNEAARLETRVRTVGLKPYVLEANLGAKGTWYRVRVGAFRDRESAGRFRTDVERELRTAAVVMPTH
jgi:DedD protein